MKSKTKNNMKQKKFYHSRTIWANFIILCLALFDKEFFNVFGLSEHIVVIITSILVKTIAILNIALRLFTTIPIDGTYAADKAVSE